MTPFRRRTLWAAAVVIVCVCFGQLGRTAQQLETRLLVLKGATVIDGLGHAPVSNAVVVIEGEKIKSLGGKETSYPSDATVIDLFGKFVIPGLVDDHVHYQPWLGELL